MRRALNLLFILAAACPGPEKDPSSGTETMTTTTGGPDTAAPSTDAEPTGASTSATTGATTSATTDDSAPLDLFACDLPIDCALEYIGDVEASQESQACAGNLILTDKPGIVSYYQSRTIEDIIEENHLLYIPLGNGKALRQRRARSCQGCSRDGLPAWGPPDAHRECWLYVLPDLAADCAGNGDPAGCKWPGVHDCSEVPERSCADILALLDG